MSIISGSGGASGMGASSSPSEASVMAQSAGFRDDGVPVLHVEPICTRLRQLRVEELEQDSNEVVTPRPGPQHVDTSKNKSANSGKRDD